MRVERDERLRVFPSFRCLRCATCWTLGCLHYNYQPDPWLNLQISVREITRRASRRLSLSRTFGKQMAGKNHLANSYCKYVSTIFASVNGPTKILCTKEQLTIEKRKKKKRKKQMKANVKVRKRIDERPDVIDQIVKFDGDLDL